LTHIGRDLLQFLRGSWLNLLLVFIPISIGMRELHFGPGWVFVVSAVAIIPLAGLIGQATEATAGHTGPALGGLLNATFGNATELIIALFALKAGLHSVVKASISGSILGNLLLVLGLSMFAGGLGREKQHFSRTAAGASMSMLMLAITALVMPALWELVVFHEITMPHPRGIQLSILTSLVLLGIYIASLIFSLRTHRNLYGGTQHEPADGHTIRLASAVVMLFLATILTAIESEILVDVIHAAAAGFGVTELFVGVIVVAVVGNAAEHTTAVVVARKGNMDLAFHIALGSSTQIALLVAPVLVLAAQFIGQPMDLVFGPFEIAALLFAVLNVAIVALDGESNWFEGLQLVAVYVVLALAFYFVPTHTPRPAPGLIPGH
jgi:Ca2+:H+ antiporter